MGDEALQTIDPAAVDVTLLPRPVNRDPGKLVDGGNEHAVDDVGKVDLGEELGVERRAPHLGLFQDAVVPAEVRPPSAA